MKFHWILGLPAKLLRRKNKAAEIPGATAKLRFSRLRRRPILFLLLGGSVAALSIAGFGIRYFFVKDSLAAQADGAVASPVAQLPLCHDIREKPASDHCVIVPDRLAPHVLAIKALLGRTTQAISLHQTDEAETRATFSQAIKDLRHEIATYPADPALTLLSKTVIRFSGAVLDPDPVGLAPLSIENNQTKYRLRVEAILRLLRREAYSAVNPIDRLRKSPGVQGTASTEEEEEAALQNVKVSESSAHSSH